ncbi:UNVERIFIED_CONTAM: hypothetical protein Sradi_5881600 [Sesamum radiatum]|uniref:Uncharacterized protein n=1 Tax=Sesamum radiatum TaxID=300843 RepID=A0AAW2KS09_SESRA
MNIRVSRGAVGACETNDGLGVTAKDHPTVDVLGAALDGFKWRWVNERALWRLICCRSGRRCREGLSRCFRGIRSIRKKWSDHVSKSPATAPTTA